MKEIPYKFKVPLDIEEDERVFIPRENELNKIIDGIEKGYYWSVIGPKRTGKTTFLHQIKNTLKDKHYVIYVNCADIPPGRESFYGWLIQRILQEIPPAGSSFNGIITAAYDEIRFSNFLEFFKPYDAKKKIILLFDDIEYIPFKVDFLKNWRRLHQERHRQKVLNKYCIITASSVDLSTVTSSSNAPYDVAEPFYIEDFTDEEVERFIGLTFHQLNVKISRPAKKKLIKQVAGYPSLLQETCNTLVMTRGMKRGKIKKRHINHTVKTLFKTSTHFDMLAQNLTNNNHLENLVKQVLKGEKKKFFPFKEFAFGGVGLIGEKKGDCIIRNKIFERFLKEQLYAEKIPPKKIALHVLYGILIGALFSSYYFLCDQNQLRKKMNNPALISYINYPKYIALNEKATIEISIANHSGQRIKELKAVLRNLSKAHIATDSGESTVKTFRDLKAEETKTEKIQFFLKKSFKPGNLEFKINFLIEDQPHKASTSLFKLKVLKIPYLKDILLGLFTILIGVIGLKSSTAQKVIRFFYSLLRKGNSY